MVNNYFKKLIHKALIISRLKVKGSEPRIRKNTKGFIIEFIGPSGVGKSTLFDAVKNRMQGNWHYREQQKYYKLERSQTLIDGALHWNLMMAKACNLDILELNGFRKLKLLKYFSDVVYSDLHMQYCASESGFLLEEGIFHNFSKEINSLQNDEFESLIANRILIYVRPKSNITVVNRIRKRTANTGHTVAHHIGLSDQELLEIVDSSVISFDTMIKRAQIFNHPTLTVYAEDDLSYNAGLILKFEAANLA
jgi:uridine kinase